MRNRTLLSMGLFAMCAISASAWDGVTTKEPKLDETTYYVSTAEEIAWLADPANATALSNNIVIEADIDMEGHKIAPIGRTSSTDFSGILDGQNHKISNLLIETDNTSACYYGLIGFVNAASAEIKNLKLTGEIIVSAGETQGCNVGSFVGKLNNGAKVENCHSEVNFTINGTAGYTGGIAGFAKSTDFYNCSYSGNMTVTDAGSVNSGIAGILGSYNSTTSGLESIIDGCFFTGKISAPATHTAKYAAGIVSYTNLSKGSVTITDCYSTGSVDFAGATSKDAICALNKSKTFSITNCWLYSPETLEPVQENCTKASMERFNSGEIAYKLNATNVKFGQDLSLNNSLPTLIASDNSNKVFKVTFNNDTESTVIYSNSTLKVPAAPTKDQYIFKGWEDSEGNLFLGGETINQDLTLTAKWDPTVGVDSATKDGVKIIAYDGIIKVSTTKPMNVKVFTTTGALVDNINIQDEASITGLQPGLYIINGTKVAIK